MNLTLIKLSFTRFKFYGPKIGALYARNCLEKEEIKKKAPISHPFFGAGQENGLRPGYR